MAEAGDERAALLKLDIEGSEHGVLSELDLGSLGVRVLCVELHTSRPVREARALIEGIRVPGYRLVHRKRPASYTFVHRQATA